MCTKGSDFCMQAAKRALKDGSCCFRECSVQFWDRTRRDRADISEWKLIFRNEALFLYTIHIPIQIQIIPKLQTGKSCSTKPFFECKDSHSEQKVQQVLSVQCFLCSVESSRFQFLKVQNQCYSLKFTEIKLHKSFDCSKVKQRQIAIRIVNRKENSNCLTFYKYYVLNKTQRNVPQRGFSRLKAINTNPNIFSSNLLNIVAFIHFNS